MDIATLVGELQGLVGVVAFLTALVNALKQFGIVKDGDAMNWSTGFNLLALVGLFVAHLAGYTDFTVLDSAANTAAQLLVLVVTLIVQLGLSKFFNWVLRGFPLVGYSHTLAKK